MKTIQHHFKNLNLNHITDNKAFWQPIKPYFNKKDQAQTKWPYLETSQF